MNIKWSLHVMMWARSPRTFAHALCKGLLGMCSYSWPSAQVHFPKEHELERSPGVVLTYRLLVLTLFGGASLSPPLAALDLAAQTPQDDLIMEQQTVPHGLTADAPNQT